MVLHLSVGLVRILIDHDLLYTLITCRGMAEWLSRPLLIEPGSSAFHAPNLDLDGSDPGQLSPFAGVFHRYALIYTLSERYPRPNGVLGGADPASILEDVNRWEASLPLPLRLRDPDTQWDRIHTNIPAQRLYMYSFIWMTRIRLLKSHLTNPAAHVSDQHHTEYVAMAVEACLQAIHNANQIVDTARMTNLKFHSASFTLFDTATVICAAIVHNSAHELPRQSELLAALRLVYQRLSEVASVSSMGRNCVKILARLVTLIPQWEGVSSPATTTAARDDDKPQLSDASIVWSSSRTAAAGSVGHSVIPENEAYAWDAPAYQGQMDEAAVSTIGSVDLGTYDLNGIEQIWDWESLGLGST